MKTSFNQWIAIGGGGGSLGNDGAKAPNGINQTPPIDIIGAGIANVGGTATSTVVRFYDGSTQIGSDTVYLTADSSTTAEVIWTPLKAGTRSIRVLVDPSDAVDEVF